MYWTEGIRMNVFQGGLLGLIQGLGEFLPISSSGHLLLARFFLGIQGTTAQEQSAYKVMDILLHVGTLIPLLIVFWKEWIDMLRHPVKNRTLLYLIIASVPTLVIYIAAKKLFPDVDGFAVFDSGWFLGASFLITAFFLLICDFVSSRRTSAGKKLGPVQAVIMGIFQGAGLLPGVSRSGSTIFGGVLSGLDKKKAASFSFMMSAPAILGSFLMEGKDALELGYLKEIELIPSVVGIIIAAVTGYLAIRVMLKIISKASLSWFALYLAVIGIAFLLLQFTAAPNVPPLRIPASAAVL